MIDLTLFLSKCNIPFCTLCSDPGGHDEDEGEEQELTEPEEWEEKC